MFKIIFIVYEIALVCATVLFVLKAEAHWKVQRSIRKKYSKDRDKNKKAYKNATVDAISWTAIAICGVYACVDCFMWIIK